MPSLDILDDLIVDRRRTAPMHAQVEQALRQIIERVVVAPSFPAGIEIVRRAAALAEDMDHHPDIDIRWRRVRFGLTTHDAGGVTELDLALARRIDGIAAELKAE